MIGFLEILPNVWKETRRHHDSSTPTMSILALYRFALYCLVLNRILRIIFLLYCTVLYCVVLPYFVLFNSILILCIVKVL